MSEIRKEYNQCAECFFGYQKQGLTEYLNSVGFNPTNFKILFDMHDKTLTKDFPECCACIAKKHTSLENFIMKKCAKISIER